MLAAEAEAAVEGAYQERLEKSAIRVAMDNAGNRGEGLVAHRVDVFVGGVLQLAFVREDLQADRVAGVSDQRGKGFRNCDGVAGGDA